MAVPFDAVLRENGVRASLAMKLFDDGALSLAQAAKLAGVGIEAFMERAGAGGIAVVQTNAEELGAELELIARQGRSG